MGRLTDTLIQKGGSNLTPAAIFTQNSDISGWIYRTLNDLTSTVMINTSNMDSNMTQLDSNSLVAYTTNRRTLRSNVGVANLIRFTMSYNFINISMLSTQPILDANKGLSNLVSQSNTSLRNDLAVLSSNFSRDYSNASRTILTDIETEYSKFTRSFPYIVGALRYVNTNMDAAYPVMGLSNYIGKYTYYYDFISAMFGKNSNILRMAQTSNFPQNVVSPNPVVYNYSALYNNGNIILASTMYPYISDRYLGSNYNSLSNQFMSLYNVKSALPNVNRATLSRLQACNAIFTVDNLQLSNYSNTIATDPNIATINGLRAYIGSGSNRSAIFDPANPSYAPLKVKITDEVNSLYSNTIRPRSIELMSRVETVLSQNQTDMFFFSDTDFSNLATFRGNLKQYYIRADFINYNNSNYFQNTFSNSNGERGSYLAVNDLNAVCTLGLFMSNDDNSLKDMSNHPDFNNIGTSFQTGYTNARNIMRGNIAATLSSISSIYSTTLSTASFTIGRTRTDIQKLKDRRLDGTCFTFYPTVIGASNQLNTILSNSLPKLFEQYSNASNTYMTTTSLSNLNTMSELLLYTSNNLYNNYLTASNLSNTLTGLADSLVTTFSNTYSNYSMDIVYNLPIFTGASCASN